MQVAMGGRELDHSISRQDGEQSQQVLILPDRGHPIATINGWALGVPVGGGSLFGATVLFMHFYTAGMPVLDCLAAAPLGVLAVASIVAGHWFITAFAKHQVAVSLHNATVQKLSRWRTHSEYPVAAVEYSDIVSNVDSVRIHFQAPKGRQSITVVVSEEALMQLAHPSGRWPGITPESLSAAGYPHRLGRNEKPPNATASTKRGMLSGALSVKKLKVIGHVM